MSVYSEADPQRCLPALQVLRFTGIRADAD